jgi:hypothetical protein
MSGDLLIQISNNPPPGRVQSPALTTNQNTNMKTSPKKHITTKRVVRKAWICPLCDSVYVDAPVTECDCTVGTKPNFILGEVTYHLP